MFNGYRCSIIRVHMRAMIPEWPRAVALILIALSAAPQSFAQEESGDLAYMDDVFPIMGWWGPPGDRREIDRYYQAGYTILPAPVADSWGEIIEVLHEVDMAAMYILPIPRRLSPKSFVEFSDKYVSSLGWILKDELLPRDVPEIAEEIRAFKALNPKMRTMAVLKAESALGVWENALPDLLEAGLDTVCLQRFFLPGTETDEEGLHDLMSFALSNAAAHDADVWGMAQVTAFDGHRRASESDIRLQCYSMIAMGATGLLHYAYWDPPYKGRFNNWGPAMIDGSTRGGSYGYEMCFYLNREIRMLAEHFMPLEHTGYFYVGHVFDGAPMTPPAESPIRRIEAERAMVGEFRGADGEPWVLLVNRRHGHFSAALSTAATIQVLLKDDIATAHAIDRHNGSMKPIPIGDHGSFYITIPGGTAALLKFARK